MAERDAEVVRSGAAPRPRSWRTRFEAQGPERVTGWAVQWLAVPPARYRCAACGNLTRFDVTITRRTRAYHHYTLGGDLTVEDEEVLAETVEEVACRWCASARAVEPLGPSGPTSGELAAAALDAES